VDLALIDDGTQVLVGNSNRLEVPCQKTDIGVVDVADVLAGKHAVLGVIKSGIFPRELTLEANGKMLLVANYGSNEVESVNITEVP
jgi:hypothetical protein